MKIISNILLWQWDYDSDALIAYSNILNKSEIQSFYAIEWRDNPDKWEAYFEGVHLGYGTLTECMAICRQDYENEDKENNK
jgi:hypothetical protein